MRETCLDQVYELAKQDERIFFIGSDLGVNTLDKFKKEMPGRFFMEGISEQHVVGMASGLALEGKIVYVNTISTFITRRCFEQVVVDVCLHNLNVRLIGNGATADHSWNMGWLYKQRVKRINLPSDMSEGFKIGDIYEAHPQSSVSTSNTYQAQDLRFEKLYEGRDYDWLMNQGDANPHAVLFRPHISFQWPLFLQTRRPYSDTDSFTGDSSTTTCPVHLFAPRFKMEVLSTILMPRQPNVEKWATLYALAANEFDKASHARPKSPTAVRPYWGGPMGGI